MNRLRKTESGFSLLELLIVLAIIAILVAILIPGLMLARMVANEHASTDTMRSIATAQVAHYVVKDKFDTLQVLNDGEYLGLGVVNYAQAADGSSTFVKSGYNWAFKFGATQQSFELRAIPIEYEATGEEAYFVNQTAVMRFENTPSDVPQATNGDFAGWANLGPLSDALD